MCSSLMGIQVNSTQRNNRVENNHIPTYIEQLIDKGLLFPDGKRVVKSIDSVALEMQKLNIQPTEHLLFELFSKQNWKKYSNSALKKAIIHANSQ